jgi:peptide/nickel transport system ATP-binding protein
MVPALTSLGAGCAFEPRCEKAFQQCKQQKPELISIADSQLAACWALGKDAT